SSRRRHTRFSRDWSSDVCSSDLFGVPAPVLTAFWGLETDFGAFNGDGPTLTSLATLAYDCRRPDLFRRQLMSAIKIIDRGDLTRSEERRVGKEGRGEGERYAQEK